MGYVGDLLEGRSKAPEIDRIMRLAAALDVPLGELIGDGGVESVSRSQTKKQDLPAQVAATGAKMVPLLAARIAMNAPFLDVPDTPAGEVPTLPALQHIAGAYAFTVPNDLNEPRYMAGEVVYISPAAATRPGDFVFVRFNDGLAGITRLIEFSEAAVFFRCLHSPAAMHFAHTAVRVLHRIVGSVG